MRHTKIIATVGPACADLDTMRAMVQSGVDVFRLNLSHGDHKEHGKNIKLIKTLQKEFHDVRPAILVDLQGPKLRIGSFVSGSIMLKTGQDFELCLNHAIDKGTNRIVSIDAESIVSDVNLGQELLLDDGKIILKVIRKTECSVETEVVVGGELSGKKGINLRGGGLSTKSFTPKDEKDLAFALAHDVDFVALSFVRSEEDIINIKQFISAQDRTLSVIAKIERAEAIARLEEIAQVSDGLMIARGDLALEVGLAKVPGLQKRIIKIGKQYDCFCIVATQMMESMIASFSPTRAEVSDVANAILDQTDALMLSAETSIGQHPVEVIKQMANICHEDSLSGDMYEISKKNVLECETTRVLTLNGCQVAADLMAAALVLFSESGRTALFASRQKINFPIYALSQQRNTCLKMNLFRGTWPVLVDFKGHSVSSLDRLAVDVLIKEKQIAPPDTIVVIKGDLVGVSGHTNSLEVWTVSDLLTIHQERGG